MDNFSHARSSANSGLLSLSIVASAIAANETCDDIERCLDAIGDSFRLPREAYAKAADARRQANQKPG